MSINIKYGPDGMALQLALLINQRRGGGGYSDGGYGGYRQGNPGTTSSFSSLPPTPGVSYYGKDTPEAQQAAGKSPEYNAAILSDPNLTPQQRAELQAYSRAPGVDANGMFKAVEALRKQEQPPSQMPNPFMAQQGGGTIQRNGGPVRNIQGGLPPTDLSPVTDENGRISFLRNVMSNPELTDDQRKELAGFASLNLTDTQLRTAVSSVISRSAKKGNLAASEAVNQRFVTQQQIKDIDSQIHGKETALNRVRKEFSPQDMALDDQQFMEARRQSLNSNWWPGMPNDKEVRTKYADDFVNRQYNVDLGKEIGQLRKQRQALLDGLNAGPAAPVLHVNTPEEAMRLAPGTKFYDPNGVLRVR